ncbi:hypothetical protein FB451DRAFT_1377467 [Mycena latifolia]|nr:hypothetical protein FB451DRAFT_1377467 [Mycena latifolia]
MTRLFPLLLVATTFPLLSSAVSQIHTFGQFNFGEPCAVQAWVRAEDLAPDHISQGELRVKVSRAVCADQIASVVLRLQLNEFSELVALKEGIVLPSTWQAANETTPASDMVYDYKPYAEAISDPELWTVKAEERQAWTTETTLLDHNRDLTHPIVVPFTVAVPAVNYPPGSDRLSRGPRHSRHSFSALGYQYIAIVTFADGRIVNVPAGHTTFVPATYENQSKTPFSLNTTFEERCRGAEYRNMELEYRAMELEKCLPKAQQSEFVAEITLDEGNVVQKGHPVKGRVTVHSTGGSTTMSGISIGVWTAYNHHWAQAQAAAGGDSSFSDATSLWHQKCRSALGNQPLNAESSNYAHIFDDGMSMAMAWQYPSAALVSSDDSTFTPAHPYYDFEFQVPHDTPVDFAAHYTNAENHLLLTLDVVYASEVADCMKLPPPPPPRTAADVMAAVEERLWDSYTRVGHPVNLTTLIAPRKNRRCVMTLEALVPITVVGHAAPANPVTHYLVPGALAPVIRHGARAEAAEFPVAIPVINEEPPADTAARLMLPHHQSSRFIRDRPYTDIPDPTKVYRAGDYAGLLWKKKVVADERRILPPGPGAVVPEGDGQQPLHT